MRHLLTQRWALLFLVTTSFALLNLSTVNAQDADAVQDTAVEPDADASDAAAESKVIPKNPVPLPERSEALQRRAGEQVGDNPRGSANVLGMQVQEADSERAKVIEVAVASPAFDAGIRAGDEIVSFDGFKAETYREWVDGVRRLVTDTPDGDTLPIILVRGGKTLNLRLRIPEANADEARQPEFGPLAQQQAPTAVQQPLAPQPNQPTAGGNYNSLGAGFFDDSSDNATGGAVDRAVAEIHRLNSPQQPVQGDVTTEAGRRADARARDIGQQSGGAGQQPPAGGPRIGLAGFRDDQNGMFVMLDIGGLEPGTYTVAIDDPSMLGGGAATSVGGVPSDGTSLRDPKAQRSRSSNFLPPPQQRSPGRGTPGVPAPDTGNRNVPPTTPGTPGTTPTGGQPAVDQQGQFTIPQHSVLAQVAEVPSSGASVTGEHSQTVDTPATGRQQPLDTPATGRQQPLDTPATGQVNPSGATATGQSENNEAIDNPQTGAGAIGGGAGGMSIGTLTVDESGTGRMQQVVEGVQVRAVVGQAIVIHSQGQGAAPNQILPPNLDVGAAPARSERSGQATGGAGVGSQNLQQTDPTSRQVPGGSQTVGNRRLPVAGGIIQMLPDGTGNSAGGIEQPAAVLPAQSQQPLR